MSRKFHPSRQRIPKVAHSLLANCIAGYELDADLAILRVDRQQRRRNWSVLLVWQQPKRLNLPKKGFEKRALTEENISNDFRDVLKKREEEDTEREGRRNDLPVQTSRGRNASSR